MHLPRNSPLLTLILLVLTTATTITTNAESISIDNTALTGQNQLFTIDGKVNLRKDEIDVENIRILVDDGAHVAFLKADGAFTIPGLESSTYVIEVVAPRNVYEPVRVDINSKGKIRTRRLNLLQPADVTLLRYPLNFESKGYPNYFFKREAFRVLDLLMSPMVLMMVVPLILVLILPKLVNSDPELQRELQNTTSMLQPGNQPNLPNMSEMMYNMFDGGSASKKKPAKKTRGEVEGTKRK
jgi:hypothetical protein